MRYPLGMARGVRDADSSTLRNAQKRERLARTGRFHDSLEIGDPAFEGEIADIPFGHPAATFVVAYEPEVTRQKPHPVAPDRALPLVFEVREPVRRLDEDRASSRVSPREPDAVPRV